MKNPIINLIHFMLIGAASILITAPTLSIQPMDMPLGPIPKEGFIVQKTGVKPGEKYCLKVIRQGL